MSETEPMPELSYTREDFLHIAYKVLIDARMYDDFLPFLADELSFYIKQWNWENAAFHGIDLTPLVELHDEAVGKAVSEMDELIDELNRGMEKYGTVMITTLVNGEPLVDLPVERFTAGDELGSILPVVDGRPLTLEEYTVSWRPGHADEPAE